MPWPQKLVEGVFETLCLVFQQGTALDPISIAGKFGIVTFISHEYIFSS